MLPGLGAGGLGQQAAATPPPVTPAPTLASLGSPPVTAAANSLTNPSSVSGLGGGKPAGFGGFGDAATPAPVAAATPAPTAPTLSTPVPTPPVALSTALGGGGGQQSASNSLQGPGGQQPRGISSGGGSLGSASSTATQAPMVWNGKRPDGSADNSANGQWWCAPEGVSELTLPYALPCILCHWLISCFFGAEISTPTK